MITKLLKRLFPAVNACPRELAGHRCQYYLPQGCVCGRGGEES